MKTSILSKKFLAIVSVTGALATSGFSQTILFNNGAMVFTGATSIVQVNGGFQNDGAAGTTPIFENNGTMTIANSGTPGSVFLTNGSTLQGNGTYLVEQDWVNDATFTANSSTVNLNGDLQQFITSTTGVVTTFNNLILSGTGAGTANRKKTLQLVNANVGTSGILTINDRELETQTNTMFVLNPAVTAVTNTSTFGAEGFVSSAFGGTFSRATNSSSVYSFPTGSSTGTLRYREIKLTPASAAANVFTARLGNNTATVDGFNVTQIDTTMCKVTALFYHQINRTAGADNADIAVFYNLATDGPWDGLAQWNTPTAALWNNMGTVTTTTAATYNDNKKISWSDFSNSPYILAREKLADPVFACADVCVNSTGNVFTASGAPAGSTYVWTTPAGTTITSGSGTNSITVDWGAIGGAVVVIDTNSVGCYSDPYSCIVNVSTPPTALFDTTSAGFTYNFTDQSTGGATTWFWDFGDGTTSSSQNPSHVFTANGIQTVCMTAGNGNGCVDSICYTVDVNVFEFIIIPNVFTPDGDGVNDDFFINSSGFKEFSIEIFNRWGLKVFEAQASTIKWDGRSTAGVELTDGTYYYILKGISVTNKDHSTKGFINLLRNK
ncbi:MAG TPA: gliding motility-associated C-terminal domain-containing protein [Bacteroidia bacterium]|jgi:gliding motility-associated-like protein